MKSEKFIKSTTLILVFTLLTKICGVLREVVLAHYYGASSVSDAYIISTSAYSLLFSALSGAITISYIKHISLDESKANSVTTRLSILLSGFVLIISVIILIFPNIFIDLLASGINIETGIFVREFLFITIPFMFIISSTYIFQSFLETKKKYIYASLLSLITNLIALIFIPLSSNNYLLLAIGSTIAIIINFIIIIFLVFKQGFKFDFSNFFEMNDIYPILLMMIPIMISDGIHQFGLIVDKNFASYLGEGMISSFNYANKINLIISSLFVIPITTVIYPQLSKYSAKSKIEFKKLLGNSQTVLYTLSVPATFLLVFFSYEIIIILFFRGEFTLENVEITRNILIYYALSIPFIGFNTIFYKAYYALGNTITPLKYTVITTMLNVILNFIFINTIGYLGLALSTTLSLIIFSIIINRNYYINYHDNILKKLLIKNWSVIFSSLIGVIILITVSSFYEYDILLHILINSVIFTLVYSILLLYSKNQLAVYCVNYIRKKFRK